MTENAPLKRHESLVPFSRDHHFGLLLVWKIKQGLNRQIDPVRISNYVRYFFREDIFPHFEEEERHLFTILEKDDPLRLRAEEEHSILRNLLSQLEKSPDDTELLTEIGRAENPAPIKPGALFISISITCKTVSRSLCVDCCIIR